MVAFDIGAFDCVAFDTVPCVSSSSAGAGRIPLYYRPLPIKELIDDDDLLLTWFALMRQPHG